MAEDIKRDWRELCAVVTDESDSTKLSLLIRELISALNEGERSWRHSVRQPEVRNSGAACRAKSPSLLYELDERSFTRA